MDRIEQRVRDSLQARANDVEPSQDLWDDVNHRIARRQRWRVGAYALAGATAVAVGVLVVPGLLGGLTTPLIEPWSPAQEEPAVEEPVGPDEEPAEVVEPVPGDGSDETPVDAGEEADVIEDDEGAVGPTGVAEPVVVIHEDTLTLLTPGGSTTLVTLPEEGHSWFLSVAVRPGSTMDDMTIVTTTTAEGFEDLRWTRIVDGEVVVPFEPFERPYAPAASTQDTAWVSSVVWSPDGGSVAWLDQTPEGATLRTVGWDDGPGSDDTADDNAGFEVDGLMGGATLDDWVAIDDTRSVIRATMPDSMEGWYGIPMERGPDGALNASEVEGISVPDPALGPVGAVGGTTDGGSPRWLVRLGYDGALLMDLATGTRTDLPGDLMPGDGFAELWARPNGDGVLVGSRNTATAYLVVGDDLTPVSVPASDLAPLR